MKKYFHVLKFKIDVFTTDKKVFLVTKQELHFIFITTRKLGLLKDKKVEKCYSKLIFDNNTRVALIQLLGHVNLTVIATDTL